MMSDKNSAPVLSQGLGARASTLVANVTKIIDGAIAAVEKEQAEFGQLAPGTTAAGVDQVSSFLQMLTDHAVVLTREYAKLNPDPLLEGPLGGPLPPPLA